MSILDIFKPKKEVTDVNVTNEVTPIDTSSRSTINNGYEYVEPNIFGLTLKDWKDGVDTALSMYNEDRIQLCEVYQAMQTYDSQIIASINQRKLLTVQGTINIYNEDGSVNEEASSLFKNINGTSKEWFRHFLNYSLDSIFWGYELIAINIEKGEIKVKKVPEKNIIPHKSLILKDIRYGNTLNNSIKYDEGRLDFITCKISYTNNLRDLGLLSACAPSFFSKCTSEWASHTRKYGQPLRVMKMENPNDATKLKAAHTALKNMMTGSFITMGKNDEFEFHGDNSKGSEMYEKLNIECNNNISKIILGQTGTLDEKAYVGSAAVHESILGSIIKSDREFLESVVNSQLIPKLQILGLLPNNIYFAIGQEQKVDTDKQIANLKTLSDMGFKVTKEFIETNFNVELEDELDVETIKEDKKEDTNGEDSNDNL